MSYYKQTVSAESEVLLDDKVLTETTAGVGNSFILSDKTIDVSDIPVGSGYRIYYQIGCPSIMNPVSFQVTITGVASGIVADTSSITTSTSQSFIEGGYIAIDVYRGGLSKCFYKSQVQIRFGSDPANPWKNATCVKSGGTLLEMNLFNSSTRIVLVCTSDAAATETYKLHHTKIKKLI